MSEFQIELLEIHKAHIAGWISKAEYYKLAQDVCKKHDVVYDYFEHIF